MFLQKASSERCHASNFMDTPSLNLKDRTRWPSANNGRGKKAYQLDHTNDISSNASEMSLLLPKPSNESVPTVPSTAPITLGKSRRRPKAKNHHCLLCDKSFTSPSRLLDHQTSHTGESPHSCQQCDKKFHSKSQLTRHNLTHRTARAFACIKCGKSFYRKDHLNNHVRVHDPVRRFLVCEHEGCGKHYSSTLSFRKHSAIHAAEGGQLDCTMCGAAFTDSTKLLEHLKAHMGKRCVQNEKKFQCDNCALTFFTRKDVRRHQVVHTGRRDFACIYCPRKFGRKDHLVRHVKSTHTDCPWPPAPKPLKPAQVVVVKTEEKPKLESLTYLGLKFSPSISENCVNSLRSSTEKKNMSSVQSVKTSIGTLLFLEVPIEMDTVIKKEPLSDAEEIDSSNLNNMNIKTEIVI